MHNKNIWDGNAYIGLGHGAMGRIFMNNIWYEQSGGDIKFSELNDQVRATERVITGLRTVQGIKLDNEIKNVVDINYINIHNDLVKLKDNRIYATDAGMLILDELLVNLIK